MCRCIVGNVLLEVNADELPVGCGLICVCVCVCVSLCPLATSGIYVLKIPYILLQVSRCSKHSLGPVHGNMFSIHVPKNPEFFQSERQHLLCDVTTQHMPDT